MLVSCRAAGSLARSLGGNLATPGGDTFMGCGIIFRFDVGAPGISGQVLQMLGAVSGPLAPPGSLPWDLILTGRAGLGQERGFVLSI